METAFPLGRQAGGRGTRGLVSVYKGVDDDDDDDTATATIPLSLRVHVYVYTTYAKLTVGGELCARNVDSPCAPDLARHRVYASESILASFVSSPLGLIFFFP